MSNFDDIFSSQSGNSRWSDQPFDKEAWAARKQEERKDLYALADSTATEISKDGDRFRQYLDVQSRFDRYSPTNALLILVQMPEATQLKDFDGWKEQGVSVQRKPKSVKILEPGKEYDREDGTRGTSFEVKRVYDVSQTRGRVRSVPAVKTDDRVLLKALIHRTPVPIRTVDSLPNIAAALECDFDELFKIEETRTPLSDKTILEHHRLISTILAQAEKEMLITYNPAARATPPRPKKPQPDYYQPDEMDEILTALENAPLKWKTITYLLIDTGCRRGEILGLKPENVDYDTGVVVIDHALLATKSKGVYEGETKTGSMRAIRLAPQSLELLRKWKTEQLRMRLAQGDRWVDSGYIFTQDDGSRLHPDSITDWLGKFSKKHNLPHIHPHAFRHTAASTMIANGVDLVTTANELGHANASTTASIYAHQIAIAKAKAADVRAGVFASRSAKPKKKRA